MAIGKHETPNRGATDDWLTPPELIKALGPFDLDPCCPPVMPWRTAERMIHWPNDGYKAEWSGRVWLNPPYGDQVWGWLRKMADHGRGTALVFARTETSGFHLWVWGRASAVLFPAGRLVFHRPDGTKGASNAGAPSVFIAYGQDDADRLRASGIDGVFIPLDSASIIRRRLSEAGTLFAGV